LSLTKAVVIAALLAVTLGVGLGFASISLVAEIPQKSIIRALDLYTQQTGLGANKPGGIFGPGASVQFFAYLTADGLPINQTEVTFTASDPAGNETAHSALTDNYGIATINLTPPAKDSSLGNWTVTAVVQVEDETFTDSLLFQCKIASTPIVTVKTLDVYTNRGGIGFNETGGIFGPGEIVQLFAALSNGGVGINNTEVAFTVAHYGENGITESAFTDDLGKARINFTIPSGSASEGNWSVSAIAYVEDRTVSDFLFFGCGVLSANIQVVTKRGWDLSVDFKPKDNVTVDVHVYSEPSLLPIELELEVTYPDGSLFLNQPIAANNGGDATARFQIPSFGDIFGTWQIHASFEAYGRCVEGYAYFKCEPSEFMLDVYTQKGGQGQNRHSESFFLSENVALTATFLDMSNMSLIVDKLVSFEIKLNGTTFAVFTAQTNSTGMASVTFAIPQDPSFIGQWEVYARTDVYGLVLLDTLVFAVEQPQG
jgi:hypothetical protein